MSCYNAKMWCPDEILHDIAQRCDACTRESLSRAVGLDFPPQKLANYKIKRLEDKCLPKIIFDIRSKSWIVHYVKTCHNFFVKITRHVGCTAYDYEYCKYQGDKLVYLFTYWLDGDCNIVTQHGTWCENTDPACGCLLCSQRYGTKKKDLIAHMTQCHRWHGLKFKRCPVRYYKKGSMSLLHFERVPGS